MLLQSASFVTRKAAGEEPQKIVMYGVSPVVSRTKNRKRGTPKNNNNTKKKKK